MQAFLKKAAKGDRYAACQFLLETFEKATKDKAAMWGPAIVGVGAETMTYANGDQLDWSIGGFSPRAQNIAIYGMKASPKHAALMKMAAPWDAGSRARRRSRSRPRCLRSVRSPPCRVCHGPHRAGSLASTLRH